MMRRLLTTACIALLTLLWTPPAFAHHILGLPHYAYKDNFPQAPVLEYPAQSGPYDILLTSYPGRPVPGEPASVVIYAKDRTTGEPYVTPVSVRVLTQPLFGEGREIVPPTVHEHTLNQFKYTITFPEEREYIVELSMDVEGKPEVIRFLMVAGDPSAPATVPAMIGIGFIGFFVVVRAIKRKRARRANAAPARGHPVAV